MIREEYCVRFSLAETPACPHRLDYRWLHLPSGKGGDAALFLARKKDGPRLLAAWTAQLPGQWSYTPTEVP